MNIAIKAYPFRLQFRHAFHIAHGSRNYTDTVYAEASLIGKTGYGEAALPPYLGYSAEKITEEVDGFTADSVNPELVLMQVHKSTISRPAKAALDLALHDLWVKLENNPLHQLLSLPYKNEVICFYTLGISEIDVLEAKLESSRGTKVYKIKLGGENDLKFLKEFRSRSDVPFCADANQAWKSVKEAGEKIRLLKDLGCIFIEQPLPVNHEGLKELHSQSELPLYLDESIQNINDIISNADKCDGINIKLVKSGGIKPALEWIDAARNNNLKVLIGCMSESTCGAAAALQLNGFADFVDLDGPLLISNDPFEGLSYDEGMVSCSGELKKKSLC